MAKVRIWGKDLPTYITVNGQIFSGINYSDVKATSIPTYYDSVTGKRIKYSSVIRRKIKGVWVTYVR